VFGTLGAERRGLGTITSRRGHAKKPAQIRSVGGGEKPISRLQGGGKKKLLLVQPPEEGLAGEEGGLKNSGCRGKGGNEQAGLPVECWITKESR